MKLWTILLKSEKSAHKSKQSKCVNVIITPVKLLVRGQCCILISTGLLSFKESESVPTMVTLIRKYNP